MFLANSVGNASGHESIVGTIANGKGVVLESGSGWKASTAIPASEDLLSTNTGTGGNGPVTLQGWGAISGIGAYIQGDGTGSFTAQIQVFENVNGVLSNFTKTASSDSSGDPVFLGVSDTVAGEITKVIYSLTTAAPGYSTKDFALSSLFLEDPFLAPIVLNPAPADSSTPEPGLAGLVGLVLPLLVLASKRKKTSSQS
jgi:hypothetical protein